MNEHEAILFLSISKVVQKLVEKNDWDEDHALTMFYSSTLFTYLERENTKVWHYSYPKLVSLFDDECEGNLQMPDV